ncbi:hypothetical protein [Lutimonas vermicola]|uniref:Glycine zipper family protein n=1 Tax=Lutimonas vermicola TaxID=414288 RepID=A0ABU9KXP0_9FLAO
MNIHELITRPDLIQNKKLHKKFLQFDLLIKELNNKELPDAIIDTINNHIHKINSISASEKELNIQLRKSRLSILKLVEKELQLVAKNHYRNRYLGIGIALGVAVGGALGSGSGNHSLIGLGLPLGMAIGIAYGTKLDNKAKEEGKQLNLELR